MPQIWEIRAACHTPGGRYKVRIWQEYPTKPDVTVQQVFHDTLISYVQDYWYSLPEPTIENLVAYLIDECKYDCVEVTSVADDCGVSGYRVWP